MSVSSADDANEPGNGAHTRVRLNLLPTQPQFPPSPGRLQRRRPPYHCGPSSGSTWRTDPGSVGSTPASGRCCAAGRWAAFAMRHSSGRSRSTLSTARIGTSRRSRIAASGSSPTTTTSRNNCTGRSGTGGGWPPAWSPIRATMNTPAEATQRVVSAARRTAAPTKSMR